MQTKNLSELASQDIMYPYVRSLLLAFLVTQKMQTGEVIRAFFIQSQTLKLGSPAVED